MVVKNILLKKPLKVFFNFSNPYKFSWRYLTSPLLISLPIYVSAYQTTPLDNIVSVNDIEQDNLGFIWLSGQHGLNRFDGNKSFNFSTHSANWPAPFIWAHDIQVINDSILVSTESNKLLLVNTKTGKSSPINVEIEANTIYHTSYFNGEYYFYTVSPRNLYRFNPLTSTTTLIQENLAMKSFVQTKNSLYFYNYLGLYEIKDNSVKQIFSASIKTAATNNISLIFATEENLYHFQNNSILKQLSISEKVTDITFDNNNQNIFTINNKNIIKQYDLNFTSIPHNYFTTQKAHTKKIFHDDSNTLWLLSSEGANRVSPNNIKNHLRVFDTPINAIEVELLSNNIILGSYGAGLYGLTNDESVVQSTINQKFSEQGLIITDLLTIDDDLFIATFDGLWHYNVESKQLQKLPIENNNKILLKLVHKNNNLYVATDENGFFIYDLTSKEVTLTVNEKSALSSPEVIDILPLENNTWLANSKNIDIYNHQTKEITTIELNGASKVMSLVYANNKIFAATKGDGLFVFSQEKELLSHFAKGINFGHMKLINDEIWAPSRHGLYRISPINNHLTMIPGTEEYSFSSEPILHNNAIYIGNYSGVLEVPLTSKEQYNAKIYNQPNHSLRKNLLTQ